MNTRNLVGSQEHNRQFLTLLGRAFGGAILFALPILMTMEMWWLGVGLEPWRIALLLSVNVPLLIVFSYYIGFRDSFSPQEDVVDAFVAVAVGFVASAASLLLFSVIEWGMSADEIIGKIAVQAVPGSIGAILAAGQLGLKTQAEKEGHDRSYLAELVFMLVGALYLAFNLAPTDEIVLITAQFTPWHALALIVVSLVIMHAFVYNVEFRGQEARPEGGTFWGVFVRFTIVGYAVALMTSLFILWLFGRTEGESVVQILELTVVLGFPAAVGAAAARLIV